MTNVPKRRRLYGNGAFIHRPRAGRECVAAGDESHTSTSSGVDLMTTEFKRLSLYALAPAASRPRYHVLPVPTDV